ncbi:MAG: ribosome silencing factor [Nitrospirota bacterium]|nr:ribosome silencing factor [Nitrospirota bacterium]
MVSALETARIAAEAAENKKALDVTILDINDLSTIADYFMICSATNITQIGAIADGIGHALAEQGIRPSHIEGGSESTWVLMDYGDVIVHIFDEQTRSFYGLERLWGDAKRVRQEASGKVASS